MPRSYGREANSGSKLWLAKCEEVFLNTGSPRYPKVERFYEAFRKSKWRKVKSIPDFRKVQLTTLCFSERPILVPIFANQKKSEEDFHF